MTPDDEVLGLLADANPVSDPNTFALDIVTRLRLKTIEQGNKTMTEAELSSIEPPTTGRTRRGWLIAAATFAIVMIVSVGLMLSRQTDSVPPVATPAPTPTTTATEAPVTTQPATTTNNNDDVLSSDAYVEIDTTGLYAATLDYLLSEDLYTSGPMSEVVYVVGPSQAWWARVCLPMQDGMAWSAVSQCDLFWPVQDDSTYEFTESAQTEIEDSLSPAVIRWVKVTSDALMPLDGTQLRPPVRDDASFVEFGVPIESDGVIYLPVENWVGSFLIMAIPEDSGWRMEAVVASY